MTARYSGHKDHQKFVFVWTRIMSMTPHRMTATALHSGFSSYQYVPLSPGQKSRSEWRTLWDEDNLSTSGLIEWREVYLALTVKIFEFCFCQLVHIIFVHICALAARHKVNCWEIWLGLEEDRTYEPSHKDCNCLALILACHHSDCAIKAWTKIQVGISQSMGPSITNVLTFWSHRSVVFCHGRQVGVPCVMAVPLLEVGALQFSHDTTLVVALHYGGVMGRVGVLLDCLHHSLLLFVSLRDVGASRLEGTTSTIMYRQGPRLNMKTVFPGMGILMLKIRRSWDRLIFNMGIPILVRGYLYIETGPRVANHVTVLVSTFVLLAHCGIFMYTAVFKIKASPTVWDSQVFRRTGNLWGISISFYD